MRRRDPGPAQIQQLKDAFQLVDHDRDGEITEPDLRHILANLGIAPSDALLAALLAARPGAAPARPADRGISFPMFLTMMSERLVRFDPDAELADAFECFDDADTGLVKADEMRRWLADVGERMDPHEIDKLLDGPFTDRQGNFNYREWIKVLRVGDGAEGQS